MSQEGINCSLCGGQLGTGLDEAQLHCSFCGANFLEVGSTNVDARAPEVQVSRAEAVQTLRATLADQGAAKFAVESSRLLHVPFWQVEGKLVGWQRYRVREELPPPRDGEAVLPRTAPERDVEETASREVKVSYPACDVRALGMIGVAHSLNGLHLKRFSPTQVGADQEVCSVVHPASTALRRARLSHAQHLLPSQARRVRQRTTLLRTRVQLVYYPIWRLEYGPHVATIDGARGNFLVGSGERDQAALSTRWLAAASASGFLSGFHPALGVYGLVMWAFLRFRAAAERNTVVGWLSEELGVPRRTLVRLGR